MKPILVRSAVRISKGNDLALGGGNTGVASHGEAKIFLMTHAADARVLARDLRRTVGRAVIHEDDLTIRIMKTTSRPSDPG